jgi:hypothetical protein
MRDTISDVLGLAGLAAITVGVGMLELAAGVIVGGVCTAFVSWRLGGRR